MWKEQNGEIPKGYVVHHINGVKKDNRIENFEIMPAKVHNAIETLSQWKAGKRVMQNAYPRSEETRKKVSDSMILARKNKFWSTKNTEQ